MKALLFFIVLICTGCSSIASKDQKGFGVPYDGVSVSFRSAMCINRISYEYPLLFLITIPASIVDIPVTLLTDTIFLPADLLITPEEVEPFKRADNNMLACDIWE